MPEKPRFRASTVCEAEGHLLVVRLKDPTSGEEGLYPPGGGIEQGEGAADTAERETLEETGLRVRIEPATVFVDRYPFRWNGVDYACTTHYFGATLEGSFTRDLPPVHDADYHLGAAWIPTDEALAAMSTHTRIEAAVRRVLGRLRRARWRQDPKLSGPASMLIAIHDHFRTAAERLLFTLDEGGALESGWLARAFRPLADTLHHHHYLEEMMLFPRLEDATRLQEDHRALGAAIDAAAEALQDASPDARTVVTRFNDVLIDHLDREEAIVIPALAAMTSAEVAALLG